MKLIKWLLIIGLSAGAGFAISRIGPNYLQLDQEASGHDEHIQETNCVDISIQSQELIGIKTIKAARGKLIKKIPVSGQIAQESETVKHITSPDAGDISGLKAKVGSIVEEGDVICTINGPNGTSREIKSPLSGTIIGSFVKEGERVDSISSICTIADHSKLHGTFDVYEKDVAAVKTGQKILVKSTAYPEKVFEGEIVFISPRVDKDSHTVKIRGIIENPQNLLKLGMFIVAELIVVAEDENIIVPQQAVQIINGQKGVFIRTADEEFEPREIKIKDETRDEAAVSEGIREGDEVVVEDVFLLKSELLKSKMGAGCAE